MEISEDFAAERKKKEHLLVYRNSGHRPAASQGERSIPCEME
jgi:hypothetical protein